MKERRRGSIITISSAAGRRPHPKSPIPYSVAKAGIELLSQDVAVQAGPYGIRVNCIAPETILKNATLNAFPRSNLHRWWMLTHSSVWVLQKMLHKRQFFLHQVRRAGSPAWCWTLRAEL
jgi:NAD(P)-dependent dehydrogenase (short-subunit alcohol dehydrogenase family)